MITVCFDSSDPDIVCDKIEITAVNDEDIVNLYNGRGDIIYTCSVYSINCFIIGGTEYWIE